MYRDHRHCPSSEGASVVPEPRATVKVKVELCLTLCDPTDCSLPGSSVHGIFLAQILEYVDLTLFIVIFPKPHLTSHTRIPGRE